MSSSKFKKPHLSPSEKEKKAEAFLGFLDVENNSTRKPLVERRLEKEAMKSFPLRVPETLFTDLREIAALTGISMNAICLELLRPAVKKKLRELKESE